MGKKHSGFILQLSLVFITVLVDARPSAALDFKVKGIGGQLLAYQSGVEVLSPMTLLDVSRKVLGDRLVVETFTSPTTGTDQEFVRGIKPLLGTPTEKGWDKKRGGFTKNFGWCYRVNGQLSVKDVSKVKLQDPDNVEWFYGYETEFDDRTHLACRPAKSLPRI